MRLAASILALACLAFASEAKADEDLVAKREFCRQEAKDRIAPKSRTGTDAYRRIVERRNAHVAQCMTRPLPKSMISKEKTKPAVVKEKEPSRPRPPKRRRR
ncbi:hypothetical protein [Microvirga pudoricolor]|uniref:hypothetical protein n=1 Tax=Microvirga pudoricolor TaxID=2778729 RepID=UPI00194F322E|nr:hypothetical protein [Microvirga pudoricolor]MBM6593231.1 hypothetical protein [Microvirga pudoricolor]